MRSVPMGTTMVLPPAAAARAAALAPQRLQSGQWLTLGGMLLANSAVSAFDVMSWVPPVLYAALTLGWLGAAYYARAVQRAAAAAGVAPAPRLN